MTPLLKTRAKDGGPRNNNGGNTEVVTGETLENRVAAGQMVRRRKGQEDGRGLDEGREVAGGETGDRERLDQVGETGVAEVEATLMRDRPGVMWMKRDLSGEAGEGEMWVEVIRTGGVPSPPQQHRYQTAKWLQ